MAENNAKDLINRMRSDEDSARKMAVFKLQQVIGDPSFADVFIQEGGLSRLRSLCLRTSGNTLAYSLGSLNRLLELDMGWEIISEEMIEHFIEIVVTQPLVNMLRSTLSILVAIVSHPHATSSQPGNFGFRALKPALAIHTSFLEMLVSRLSSADHALCANALALINSLMRDSIAHEPETEWPKLVKRFQDLGVIKAVYQLMQSASLIDVATPVLEFQSLTKLLLRKWREVNIDLEKSEHRRALKGIHLASNPPPKTSSIYTSTTPQSDSQDGVEDDESEGKKPGLSRKTSKNTSRRHHPEKWRRLGFASESPSWEFEEVGFLGMMDLTDWVRRREDSFQKLLLEQATKLPEQRCPIARASLAVTLVLYEHFEIDRDESDDTQQRFQALEGDKKALDHVFRPLLLQWSRLHSAGLAAFMRLWKDTGAEADDFGKVEDLVRILVEQVIGQAPRTKELSEVEVEMAETGLQRLRDLQMELLELTYEDAWGQHLKQVREELNHEALQFVKEQRIRCLLAGAWFPNPSALPFPTDSSRGTSKSSPNPWRFVKLSHNRRHLHYADFPSRNPTEPTLSSLPSSIDLTTVTSVTSNVSASAPSTSSSDSTLKKQPSNSESKPESEALTTNTKITIHGLSPNSPSMQSQSIHSPRQPPRTGTTQSSPQPTNPLSSHPATNHHSNLTPASTDHHQQNEISLLTLHPQTHALASEFLDGLLMLLNQQPITSDTAKLVQLVSGYGLRIRLLNVRYEDLERAVGLRDGGDVEGGAWEVEVPSREGVDEEFWYDIGGGV
ncbi:MAG: hypothetical protein M1820_007473 [Bogoriella megaspora]|nr:MAG: hypothetical protein M1820_007473 [Bogoriella megaspora]